MMQFDELRELLNNETIKLGYYSKSAYNKNITTDQFTELTYRNKPLLKSKPTVNKTVYSILQESSESFNNTVEINLRNDEIREIVAENDIRETTLLSQFKASDIDLKKDYIYRLYYYNGVEYVNVYTGECSKLTSNGQQIKMMLDSRLSILTNKSGVEIITELAGFPENITFGNAIQNTIEDTNIEIEGDIDSIDYAEVVNEGDADIQAFNDTGGVFYLEEDFALIEGVSKTNSSEYGTKYDYAGGTIENYSREYVEHYTFIEDNIRYSVIEKEADFSERVSNYGKVYLLNNDTDEETFLGYARVNEIVGYGVNSNVSIGSIENYYVNNKTPNYTGPFYRLTGEGDDSFYFFGQEGTGGSQYIFGQVVNRGSYYIPFVTYSYERSPARISAIVYANGDYFNGAEVQTEYYDDSFFTFDILTKKRNKSTKSRSYFVYDETNKRLIFQGASTTFPSGAGYDINPIAPAQDIIQKNWSSFGLNPLRYYNFADGLIKDLKIDNDNFINDWYCKNGKLYAIIEDVTNIYKTTNIENRLVEIKTNGDFYYYETFDTDVRSYGLSAYTYNSVDYVGFVKQINDKFYYSYYNGTTTTNKEIGDKNVYFGLTSAEPIAGEPTIFYFDNGQLSQLEIFTDNKIKYIATNSNNVYGGYIVKNKLTDDLVARIENSVISFNSQVRVDLFNCDGLNKLQAFLKLIKLGDKFCYIDSRDVVIIKDRGNLPDNSDTINNIVSVEIEDYEGYKTLDIKSHYWTKDDLFSATLAGKSEDFLGTVEGEYLGRDCSWSMVFKVLSNSSFSYKIDSTSEILATEETEVTGITDWQYISIPKGNDVIIIKFKPETIGNDPVAGVIVNIVFNTKKLEQTSVITTETVEGTTDLSRTKTISNNRFISPNIAPIYKDEVKSYFLSEKKIYKVVTTDSYYNFAMGSIIDFTFYKEKIYNKKCYILKAVIKSDGLTQLILREV